MNKNNNINNNKNNNLYAVVLAVLAAVFYALSTPLSKKLLNFINPTFMAAFLYLGAGLGVLIMYLIKLKFNFKNQDQETKLTKSDLPYTIGMVVLDIIAPILLMLGIKYGTASNASLLNNFEIVATSLIALIFFKEKISFKLWIAISLIIISSMILSINNLTDLSSNFSFSKGSVLVILATICWGLENNCTRKISNKSTYQIVSIKGIFSGLGSLIISIIIGESLPEFKYILLVLLLGFIAYGLSIFMYIKAQSHLGASKTSAYYALAPFIGTFLSWLINKETLYLNYFIGLIIMIIGTVFVVLDTLNTANN